MLASGGSWPSWSSDGQEIFFRGLDGGVHVAAVEANGEAFRASRPRQLIEGGFFRPADVRRYFYPSIDGRRFVMFERDADDSTTGHEHIHVVLNWLNELERTFAGSSR